MSSLHRAFEEAKRLGHQWVGPEHVLLAILRNPSDSVARQALGDLTATAYEEALLESLLNTTPPIRSEVATGPRVSPAPIYYRIGGWVAGYAAGIDIEESDEIVLLALCAVMERQLSPGLERQTVADSLAAKLNLRRLRVPADLQPTGERIDVPLAKLDAIRLALMDADMLIGFNTDRDNDQAWVLVRQADEQTVSLIETATAE